MKTKCTLAFLILMTFNLMAAEKFKPEICFSSGECQEKHSLDYSNICYKVITGLDANGNATCTHQCVTMPFGYTCEKFKEASIGICKHEQIPQYNSDTSNCYGALDPSEAP